MNKLFKNCFFKKKNLPAIQGTQVQEDCKCRGKTPHAEEQLGPQATTAEPVSCNSWDPQT